MPPLNLLIKPSSGMCSLNCTYCFYHDLMSKREVPSYGFMSEETSRALIRKALAYATGQCSFGFQGGEPTMIGLDFYQTFVELVKEYNHKTSYRPTDTFCLRNGCVSWQITISSSEFPWMGPYIPTTATERIMMERDPLTRSWIPLGSVTDIRQNIIS